MRYDNLKPAVIKILTGKNRLDLLPVTFFV
jgi:hypothetical protein